MLSYIVVCAAALMAGRGLLRLIGFSSDSSGFVFLAPVLSMTMWSVLLGWAVLFSIPLAWAVPFIWALTAVLSLVGSQHATREMREFPILMQLVGFLPIILLAPAFWHGLIDYTGSWYWDKWYYIARGWMTISPDTMLPADVSPLVEYVQNFTDVRFAASTLLAFISPLTGHPWDTLSAVNPFQAFSLFCYSSSMAFFLTRSGFLAKGVLPGIWSSAALVCLGLSGWTLDVVVTNNFDNLLALSLLPALAGLVWSLPNTTYHEEKTSIFNFALPAGILVGGLLFIYPELCPAILGCAFLFMVGRIINEKQNRSSAIAFGPIVLVIGCIIASPWIPTMIIFFKSQLHYGFASPNLRPGVHSFQGLLNAPFLPSSLMGLWLPFECCENTQGWFTLYTGIALPGIALILVGIVQSLRIGAGPLFASALACALAAAIMGFGFSYDYGMFKFLLIGWFCFIILMLLGCRKVLLWCRARDAKHIGASIIGLFIACFVGVTLFHVMNIDQQTSPKTTVATRALENFITNLPAGGIETAIVDYSHIAPTIWALRDRPIAFFSSSHPYFTDPNNMRPQANRLQDDILYILTDRPNAFPQEQIVYQGGPFRLYQVDSPKVFISSYDFPEYTNKIKPDGNFRIGPGNTILKIQSDTDTTADMILAIEPEPGSLPNEALPLQISTDTGFKEIYNITPNSIIESTFPVRKGVTQLILSPQNSPQYQDNAGILLANVNELILTAKGQKASYIMEIKDPLGIDVFNSEAWRWLNENPLSITVYSTIPTIVNVQGRLMPGPSLPGVAVRFVTISTSAGYAERRRLDTDENLNIRVPVPKGLTKIEIHDVDKPTAPVPGDPRTLLLAIGNLDVSFDKE